MGVSNSFVMASKSVEHAYRNIVGTWQSAIKNVLGPHNKPLMQGVTREEKAIFGGVCKLCNHLVRQEQCGIPPHAVARNIVEIKETIREERVVIVL
jgi:hypothetical protein